MKLTILSICFLPVWFHVTLFKPCKVVVFSMSNDLVRYRLSLEGISYRGSARIYQNYENFVGLEQQTKKEVNEGDQSWTFEFNNNCTSLPFIFSGYHVCLDATKKIFLDRK